MPEPFKCYHKPLLSERLPENAVIKDWDDAYSNGAYIADAATYPPAWNALAAGFRANVSCETNLRYGDNEREVLDIFYPSCHNSHLSPRMMKDDSHNQETTKGLMVFVHGGYWRAFDKSTWSHLAAGCIDRGWAVAMPSYPLAPEARIREMTGSIAKAINFAAEKVTGPICLSGHSAGGHLVARMACEDSPLSKEAQQRIKSVMSISGLHDLRPLMNTAMNDDWRMDKVEAVAESPALLEPLPGGKVNCWVGGDERPEFLRQNDLLVNIWSGLGADISSHHEPDKHHFNVIEGLLEAESAMVKTLLGDL